jgi:hypothetical protein
VLELATSDPVVELWARAKAARPRVVTVVKKRMMAVVDYTDVK